MSDWQPIETAPTDGTEILCCAVRPDGSPWICAVRLEGPDSKQGNNNLPRVLLGMAIWYPTHWMPLPEPPK